MYKRQYLYLLVELEPEQCFEQRGIARHNVAIGPLSNLVEVRLQGVVGLVEAAKAELLLVQAELWFELLDCM